MKPMLLPIVAVSACWLVPASAQEASYSRGEIDAMADKELAAAMLPADIASQIVAHRSSFTVSQNEPPSWIDFHAPERSSAQGYCGRMRYRVTLTRLPFAREDLIAGRVRATATPPSVIEDVRLGEGCEEINAIYPHFNPPIAPGLHLPLLVWLGDLKQYAANTPGMDFPVECIDRLADTPSADPQFCARSPRELIAQLPVERLYVVDPRPSERLRNLRAATGALRTSDYAWRYVMAPMVGPPIALVVDRDQADNMRLTVERFVPAPF
jgi:hypothetical protein